MGVGELLGAGRDPGGLQGVLGFHLARLPEQETAAQLGKGWKEAGACG